MVALSDCSRIGCVMCAVGLWASPLTAQSAPRIIDDAIECRTCAITFRRVAVLGTSSGDGEILGGIQAISVDNAGRYWILSRNPLPMLYDSTGRFLRSVGRVGDGPGEFRSPVEVIPISGDSVMIAQPGKAIIMTGDLEAKRQIILNAGFFPIRAMSWPDAVVANGFLGTRAAAGRPLHLLSLSREVVDVTKSFGPDADEMRPKDFPLLMQRIAVADQQTFWSADWSRYRLVKWSRSGNKELVLERRPAWFPDTKRASGFGAPDRPPDPGISAIHVDSAGLVWVFAKVPAPTWRRAWPQGATQQSEFQISRIAVEELYRTTIEVIDPAIGRVIARTTVDGWVMEALPGRRGARYVVAQDQTPRIEILAFSLTGR